MTIAKPRLRVWMLMVAIPYVAVDCAAFCNAIWHGSKAWAIACLVLTVFLPLFAGIWWLARRIDWSGNTLY
jgi:hypothetical protein